jgi:hypothetical protein
MQKKGVMPKQRKLLVPVKQTKQPKERTKAIGKSVRTRKGGARATGNKRMQRARRNTAHKDRKLLLTGPFRPVRPSRTNWEQVARMAGRRYAIDHPLTKVLNQKQYVNSLWCSYYFSAEGSGTPSGSYLKAASGFLSGYFGELNRTVPDMLLIPTNRKVSAVVTVLNEEETIADVLSELRRLPLHDMVVVVNGSSDQSFEVARTCSDSTILHYAAPLGHDVGRAVGAKFTDAEIILFLDGDFAIQAEQLISYIYAIEKGADVVLNEITPFLGRFDERDGVTIMKEFLNRVLGRPDLKANSLTAVPHALSRRAVEVIGVANLAVPPKAQALAIKKGLRVQAGRSINVITTNRMRKMNSGKSNPVAELIIGDHLEAVKSLMEDGAVRLAYADNIRDRQLLKEGDS